MKKIIVRVTAAHIAGVVALGYGPKIIMAALRDRLIPLVFMRIDECWLLLIHDGRRFYIHLPLQLLTYTLRMRRVQLLQPVTFRIELPAHLIRTQRSPPRKPAA